MKKFWKAWFFCIIILGSFSLYAMEEEEEETSSTMRPISSHFYEKLSPLYTGVEDNFLHTFFRRMNESLNCKEAKKERGVVERPRVFFSHAYEGSQVTYDNPSIRLMMLLDAYFEDFEIPSRADFKNYKVADTLGGPEGRMHEDVTWADDVVVLYTRAYARKVRDSTTGVYAEWNYAKAGKKRIFYLVMEEEMPEDAKISYLRLVDPSQFYLDTFQLIMSLFLKDYFRIELWRTRLIEAQDCFIKEEKTRKEKKRKGSD